MTLARYDMTRYGTDMLQTDRYILTRRHLAERGVDLDALVSAARAEGAGWRVVADRIAEAAGGEWAPAFTTVARWYADREPAAA